MTMLNPPWIPTAIALGNQFHYRKQNPVRHNALNLSMLAALLGLILLILGSAPLIPAGIYLPVGGFLLGVLFFALIILVIHEAAHDMFLICQDRSRARFWNRLFGWAVSVPFAINYAKHWEEGHHLHHLHPLEPSDPQADNNMLVGPALVYILLKMILIPAYVLRWNTSRKYKSHRFRTPANLAFWLLAGSFVVWAYGWKAGVVLVIGFGILGALNQLKTGLEHGGELGTEENRNFRSRTSLFPLRWLIMPLNISLHFEHHLNYCVPWYALPRYHRALHAVVPAPLQPEVFNVRIWDQLMGRIGRLPEHVRPYMEPK